MMSKPHAFSLDSVAIRLAADAGQVWTEMDDFPAYTRNVWRDEAREHALRTMPGAMFEITPSPWDGADAEYIVRLPKQGY